MEEKNMKILKHLLPILFLGFLLLACTNETAPLTNSDDSSPLLNGHFPQLKTPPNAYYNLPDIRGELVLENGCLRVKGVEGFSTGDSFLLIWDPRFSAKTEQGVVQVIDRDSGETLVKVGDYVEFGNNGGDNIRPTKEPIPEECKGPYLVVGEFIRKTDKP
jgi:hypothetical protein